MSGAPPETFRDEELLADVICRLIGKIATDCKWR